MKCPVCFKDVPPGKKFCIHCGSPLPKVRYCTKCGAPIEGNAKFCRSCGTLISPQTFDDSSVNEDKVTEAPIRDSLENESTIDIVNSVQEREVLDSTTEIKGEVVAPKDDSVEVEVGTASLIPNIATNNIPEESSIDPIEFNNNSKKGHLGVWIAVACVLLAAGGFMYWKFVYLQDNPPKVIGADEIAQNADSAISPEVDTIIIEEDPLADEAVEIVERIQVPNASNLSSADAYEIYPDFISDESMGDNWRSTDFIKRVTNGNQVAKQLSATGTIKGNSIRFEAVQLKNGRIYGRYNHSNGTKLDVNGVEDSDGNLIIKLGHGSAISYWVLHKNYHEDSGNVIVYSGSWGRNNADTDLRIVASHNSYSNMNNADDKSNMVCASRLSEEYLSGLSKSQLRILRNTIYARHGRKFKSKDLNDYFSKFSWYSPRFDEISVNDLSEIEKYNLSLIQKYE